MVTNSLSNSFPEILQHSWKLKNQVEDAINSNDVNTLQELIHNGFDVNNRLHYHGGDTALHLATKYGHNEVIEALLLSGANPIAKNDLNITPVSIAAKGNKMASLERLIEYAEKLPDISALWMQFGGSICLWKDSDDMVLATLIRSTPTFASMRSNVQNNLFYLLQKGQMYDSLKILVLTGNMLTAEQENKFHPVQDKAFLDWLKSHRVVPQSLKHYCRLAVRRSFQGHHNVFYSARRLPIPKVLQNYICLRDLCAETI